MKLIAEGNELVEPLLTHDEELEYIDDCNPYVLTVIKGPMTFIADDLDFLARHGKAIAAQTLNWRKMHQTIC